MGATGQRTLPHESTGRLVDQVTSRQLTRRRRSRGPILQGLGKVLDESTDDSSVDLRVISRLVDGAEGFWGTDDSSVDLRVVSRLVGGDPEPLILQLFGLGVDDSSVDS